MIHGLDKLKIADYAMTLEEAYKQRFEGRPGNIELVNEPIIFGSPARKKLDELMELNKTVLFDPEGQEGDGAWATTAISPHFYSMSRRYGDIIVKMGRLEYDDHKEDIDGIRSIAESRSLGAIRLIAESRSHRFYVEPTPLSESIDVYMRNPHTINPQKYPPGFLDRYAIISPFEARITENLISPVLGLRVLDQYVLTKDTIFKEGDKTADRNGHEASKYLLEKLRVMAKPRPASYSPGSYGIDHLSHLMRELATQNGPDGI